MAELYSNPLPPPPRPGAPPAVEQHAQPKSNADFRALLATPRAERGSYKSSFGGSSGASNGNESQEKKEKKPKKAFKPKPAEAEEKVEDDGAAYRDRAEERRKGVNPDYDAFAADMSAGGPAAATQSNLTIDETKFLGGDVEHTHLVKGLDYALLQKVRTEESTKETEEAIAMKERAKMLKARDFKTAMGRQVFDAIFRPPKRDVSQMFLPRRMAFVYDLEDGETLDIPTTLHRSKADCPKPVESLLGVMDGAVLERLAKIMGYMRVAPGSKPGKRLKKRDKQRMLEGGTPIGSGGAATPSGAGLKAPNGLTAVNGAAEPGPPPPPPRPARPANDDDDIFGGVGAEYELPEKRAAGNDAADKPATYFENRDEMMDLPALPTAAAGDAVPPPPPPLDVPPPPPPDADTMPGPAMPPADYNYDYSAAYAAVPGPEQQQWAQQGYDASAYGPAAMQYDAYGQPIAAYQAAVVDPGQEPDPNRELTALEKEAGLGSVFKRDDDRLNRIREQDEREKDPAFVLDAYAECYPAFHEFGNTVVDSDEEDMSHMDKKGEKNTSRANFNTEEEWQAHKSKQETLPKAAFQFGLKMADGRKTHKNLVGKANNKLKNELNSIKDILDKKGGSYGRAFDADNSDSYGGATPAKRKRVI